MILKLFIEYYHNITLMNMKRSLPIMKSLHNINNYLNDDIFNIIFSYSTNKDCIFVCKLWHDIIIRCGQKCQTCHKIIKMCGVELWVTDDDEFCHEYYGTLEEYKTLKEMVNYQPRFIKDIKNQTHKLCEIATYQNPETIKNIQDKYKTKKMMIGLCSRDLSMLKYFPDNIKTEDFWIDMIEIKPESLQYITNQTDNICMTAVKKNGSMLQYVTNKTYEICVEAVKNVGYALLFVENPGPELCLMGVKTCGMMLKFIENQTYEMCLEGVKNDGVSLKYAKFQSEEICIEAIKQTYNAFEYVREQTEEMCKMIAHKRGYFELIKHITKDICVEAVKRSPYALAHIPDEFLDNNMLMNAIKNDSSVLKYIKKEHQTKEICLEAIKIHLETLEYVHNKEYVYDEVINIFNKNPMHYKRYFKYIDNLPEDLCWTIIKESPTNIIHIKYPSLDMCIHYIDINLSNIKYINNPPIEAIEYAMKKNCLYVNKLPNPTLNQYMEAFKKNGQVLDYSFYIQKIDL